MSSKQKRKLTEFLFLLPTLFAFLMVIIIPFIYGIYYSFTDWQGTGAATKNVGFDNYAVILSGRGLPAFLSDHAAVHRAECDHGQRGGVRDFPAGHQ